MLPPYRFGARLDFKGRGIGAFGQENGDGVMLPNGQVVVLERAPYPSRLHSHDRIGRRVEFRATCEHPFGKKTLRQLISAACLGLLDNKPEELHSSRAACKLRTPAETFNLLPYSVAARFGSRALRRFVFWQCYVPLWPDVRARIIRSQAKVSYPHVTCGHNRIECTMRLERELICKRVVGDRARFRFNGKIDKINIRYTDESERGGKE